MGFLTGKRIVIMGLISNRSIAYGIAKACHREGADLAFTYQNERFLQRVTGMAEEMGNAKVIQCDVAEDAQIDALFHQLQTEWGTIDGLVHAIGFAPREAIAGKFLDGATRDNFRIAHDIYAYSFIACAKAAAPLMAGRSGAMLTLTYMGSERVIPNYNTMGLAKASLEAGVRYLASDLGPRGIRVNGISAGPIRTLAASGIKGFSRILDFVETHSPMRRNVSIDDVGNVAAFMLSDLSAGITAEITYVDNGFSKVAAGVPDAPEESPS